MNILVTGAAGFVGRNLVENLKNIQYGKNWIRPNIRIEAIYEYDRCNSMEELDKFCSNCTFVFNLAGINRPQDSTEFKEGNLDFASTLIDLLKKHNNKAPIMLSSSIQATLAGRFGTSEYGISKRDGEELFFRYAKECGVDVYVYRFPNLVGKWIRPNYNSAIGTFCYNYAHDLPIQVNDSDVELELLFIDDLLNELYDMLEGHPHCCEYPEKDEIIDGLEYDGVTPRPAKTGKFCHATVTHKVTLGKVIELLDLFKKQPETLIIPDLNPGSF